MIYGKRIRLRAVEREDLPKFVEWMNDPEVTTGLLLRLPLSMAEEQRWFEGLAQRPPAERVLAIEIRDGDTWRMIGTTAFHEINTVDREAEFGISIGDKSAWNQGYGAETTQLMLRHGFETLNLNRIYLHVHADNPRAIRTYEKVGYVHEGCMREAVYKRGQYHDVHIMSVLRSEWDELKDK
jgi:diamine N-acetyltransferase